MDVHDAAPDLELDWLGDPVDVTDDAAAIARLRDCAEARVE